MNKLEKVSKNNKIILRNEKFGPLIWSWQLDSYFLPDELGVRAIRGEVNEDLELARLELKKIGFPNNVETLNNKSKRKLISPLEVYFDYTWSCNLSCPHCYNGKRNKNISLTKEQIIHVIMEMRKNGVMRVHLAGGEPMSDLNKLSSYIMEVKNQGMRMSINSNGTLINDSALDLILNNDLVTSTFSLDGPDAIRNDKTRGDGTFYLASRGIKRAVHLKKSYNSSTKIQLKMFWNFNTPLKDFKDMVDYALELGVDTVQFHCPEKDSNDRRDFYEGKLNEYYGRVSTINGLVESNKGKIFVQNVWNPLINRENIGIKGMVGCIGGQELIGIHPDGGITPCMMNPYNLGNLFLDYHGDFSKFWNNSIKLDNYQHRLDSINEECSVCETYNSCRGGSKARCNPDEVFSKDSLCPRDLEKISFKEERPSQIFKHFKKIYVAHGI